MDKNVDTMMMEQISIARDKLSQGEILTNDEILALTQTIQNLPEEESGIDELVEGFNQCAQKATVMLGEMLKIISDGRAPDVSMCEGLDEATSLLRDKYNDIQQLAQHTLPDDEMPEDGSTVSIYADAIKNSKYIIIRRRLKDIEKTLARFLLVKSLMQKYMDAIEPFQKDARVLLDEIRNEEMDNVDDITDRARVATLVLRVLDNPDSTSDDEEDALLDEIEKYSKNISTGLSRGRYFIPYDRQRDGIDVDIDVQTNLDPDMIDNENVSDVGSEQNIITDDTQDVAEIDNIDLAIEQSKKELTAFRVAMEEKGVALKEDEFGVLSKDASQAESKKISASIFSNDIEKGNSKAIKDIIQLLSKSGIISKELIEIQCNMPVDVLDNNLFILHNNGYIRKYSVVPGGEFYCTSRRLDKARTYKEVAKRLELRQLKEDEIEEEIEDRASSAMARMSLLKLYANAVQNNQNASYAMTSHCENIMAEGFMHKIHLDSGDDEYLVGAFWTGYDEVDTFGENLSKLFEESNSISLFICATLNKEVANTIMAELIKLSPNKIESNIYLYSASEDKYYSYESGKEVDTRSIWKNLKDEQTEESEEARDHEEGAEQLETVEVNNKRNEEVATDPTSDKDQQKEEQSDKTEPSKTIRVVPPTVDHSGQMEIIQDFFINKKIYCAPAYVRALLIKDSSWNNLYDRIAYAVNDPMKHCIYSTNKFFDLLPQESTDFQDGLMVAIGIRTFFSNQVQYDYDIDAVYNTIKEYTLLDDYPVLSNVIYNVADFKIKYKVGMDVYADYHNKTTAILDKSLQKLKYDAKMFYESIILAKKQERCSQRRFLETKKLLFDVNGDIAQYIKVVAEDDREMYTLVVDFIKNNFAKDNAVIAEDTIDSDMLWDFIVQYWNQAGEKMITKKRGAEIMSRLRTNIINVTTNAVQILIRWCNLVDKMSNRTENDAGIVYKKIRNKMLKDIADAINEISLEMDVEKNKRRAGLEAICYALGDVRRCIDGTYEENERKYFYAPFLFTDDVLLDETFKPDFDVHGAEVVELQPEYRIIKHANKDTLDVVERLEKILREDDDLGIARLIVNYAESKGMPIDTHKYKSLIEESLPYAEERAEKRKEQFIGDLELAQSYGQIDNTGSGEDKKERILQIIDTWYEDTMESQNYGFFANVMRCYLEDIKKQSKTREKDLLEQLDSFKDTRLLGISEDEKKNKIYKIQTAINEQNYTVAEDLLARARETNVEYEKTKKERFLGELLDNYGEYYKPIANSSLSFASLVNVKTKNKEQRGGKRLVDNWLPGGGRLRKERLVELLKGFGFNVDNSSVKEQDVLRFEGYHVKTLKPGNGKREVYTHPISAFGSVASEEGFRVICINGNYKAQGLIDLMGQIGNAKNTMILLDCALDEPERRNLARKCKTELGDKLFVVIDRTVMMYMVKNYDETKAQRMLMSLIVPFGYYQPYVWESSNVMPPEIFMGRRTELESIESPQGANIVYGGRQLGKSALLKKARSDVDKNENGDRAVLVDIKGLNYYEAAMKIGHALYDKGVLMEDIETTNWGELSRVIQKRLQSDENRIPYLLLLLDEADAFIDSCSENNYHPLDELKDIQSIGTGRFKFVIAGLRNIVRFKRDAIGNNSVLTHLKAMTVTPFKFTEARELIEIPLNYLGLEFPEGKESLMTLILAKTNYFPGLIQMYCAKLLMAMREKDYAGYDEHDTPIYEISEKHIKKVLADKEFTEQIREKFMITLKLDEDNYYHAIALIIAYLYHANGYRDGYSSEDILETGEGLGISKITRLKSHEVHALMEEMKELNLLRSTDDSRYLFLRTSFFEMMGTRTEVDDQLEEYMED